MQIPDKLKHYINSPHGMNMGTRGPDLKPEYARVLGTKTVDDQHIHVYFNKNTSGRSLKNIEDNGHVAVVMASLDNFESFQFKGKSVRWWESTAEELQNVEEYFKGFNEGLIKLGFADGAVYIYPHSSMVTLLMKVEEIYEQTPKAGTGKKVTV